MSVSTTPLPTDNFRRQHAELMQLGGEILALIESDSLLQRVPEVRRQLARFAGKLSMHARMEGEAFYPRLLAHDDAAVRNLAQRFVDEFGGIYDAFGQYTKHWSDAASIERDPVSFARETRGVMKLLAHRMTRESNELYPLADALG